MDHRQRILLRIGAAYDGGFGVPMLCTPVFATGLLSLPMPDPGAIWLRLDGIFLIVVALIYLAMSQNPARYLGIMPVILLGKAGSVVFYSVYVFAAGAAPMFLLFVLLDFIMFWLHLWALGPGGFARIKAALQPAQMTAA
jgi:hypothetical protein